MARRFSSRERTALYLAADGRCTNCGVELEPGWHADHVNPYSAGGPTDVINGQALCPACNLKKGSVVPTNFIEDDDPYAWQQEALEQYFRVGSPPPRFLIAAVPGAGKTRAAAGIAAELGRFTIVLVAQADTATDWRADLHEVGMCPAAVVKKDGVSTRCACGKPVRAVVMTYAQAAHPDNLSLLAWLYAHRGPCLLVCDEVHHLRSDRTWSVPIAAAGPYIDAVLMLSGTPFRSDEEPVPFVHTAGPWTQEFSQIPDDCIFEFSYGVAISLKHPPVTRVIFSRYNAPEVIWEEDDGAGGTVQKSGDLANPKSQKEGQKTRRHATNTLGEWMSGVVGASWEKLGELRLADPGAGLIVFCRNTDHAAQVADLYAAFTTTAVYTQDYSTHVHRVGDGRITGATGRREGDAGFDLKTFKDSDARVLITVRKVSEGVSVPRLRVFVYATVTRTELFFIQALGRVIRVTWTLPEGVDQTAWAFIPDDPAMRGYAQKIEDGIIDAEVKALEDDYEDEPTLPGLDVPGPTAEKRPERFVSASGEHSGITIGGRIFGADLVDFARSHGYPISVDSLTVLQDLVARGTVNLNEPQGSGTPSSQPPKSDPVAELTKALGHLRGRGKKGNESSAVSTWANLRVRRGEFAGEYGTAIGKAFQACNRQLGDLFGIWADDKNITLAQVHTALAYVREQIKQLR